MNNQNEILDDKKYNKLIVALSIIIPVAVAILFGVRIPNVEPLSFLPPIYATINGLTAVILVVALIAIKKKNSTLVFCGIFSNVCSVSYDKRFY